MTRAVFFACALMLAPTASCGGSGGSDIASACNPLGGVSCLMPWPSSVYLEEDSGAASGYRVALPPEAMPVNVDGIAIGPEPYNRYDGFAPSGVILAAFPSGVSPEGLPPHDDLEASLQPDSPTVLLNMETGERVVHFAEVDMNTDEPTERALIIRPLERMKGGARHLVAIRRSVKASDGGELTRPEGFQAILDEKRLSHPLFDKAAASTEEVLAALAEEGVPEEDLVLAWDFVTASDEMLTSDLRAMREQALPAMGENGDNLTFEASEEPGESSLTLRRLLGTHDAPNFMTNGELDDSILLRGDSGLPELDGTFTANFSALVPRCVETAELPVPVMLFGHGLFGSAEDYLDDRFFQEIANDYCFVVLAGDWIGLTQRQITNAAFAANDLNRAPALVEKLAQAVINFIALEQLAHGPFLSAPEFAYEGTPVIDPERVFYFGASLGGIMGNTFMAYDPAIERGALGVPGGAWSLLMERSYAWGSLQVPALGAYEDQYLYQMLIALLGMTFERYDPITTSARVIHDPLPNTPPKQLLLYMAIDDSLVTNLSTEMVARELGIGVTSPSVKMPWGLEPLEGVAESGLTIYDEMPAVGVPSTNEPPEEDNGTHSGVNERAAVLREVERFLLQGEVANACMLDGQPAPCDCTTGACD